MNDAQYLKVKEDFCKFITNEQLNNIKAIYRDDIKSVRRFENVISTSDLIDVLERRGILSKNLLTGFVGFYEVTKIPEPPINLNITPNEDVLLLPPVNQYGKKLSYLILLIALLICSACITLYYTFGSNTAEERTRQPSIYEEALREEFHQTHQSVPPPMQSIVINNPSDLSKFQDRKHKIYKIISEDIGRKWRDFGRELKVKEGQLDDLESQHNSSKSRALAILSMFEERSDPRSIVVDICEALIQVRRNDLRKEVEQILIR